MEANCEDKEKIVIGFNNNYLLEILKRMETETVRFKLEDKMFAIFIFIIILIFIFIFILIIICYLYYIYIYNYI